MSAVLSNVLLLEFDREVNDWVTELGGLYRRYCDDVMVVIPLEHEDMISELVYYEMGRLNQECNSEKTEIAHFHEAGLVADRTLHLPFKVCSKRVLITDTQNHIFNN